MTLLLFHSHILNSSFSVPYRHRSLKFEFSQLVEPVITEHKVECVFLSRLQDVLITMSVAECEFWKYLGASLISNDESQEMECCCFHASSWRW